MTSLIFELRIRLLPQRISTVFFSSFLPAEAALLGPHHAHAPLLRHGHTRAQKQTQQVSQLYPHAGRMKRLKELIWLLLLSFCCPLIQHWTNHFFSPRRFGVRPLPKCQMILKLKEIHQYTHQLVSSDSEDEGRSVSHTAQIKPSSVSTGNGQHPCAQPLKFQAPSIPPSTSPLKHSSEEQIELLSASQCSNTSSTAASEESGR